jgi:anti-sigma B factor antagonist
MTATLTCTTSRRPDGTPVLAVRGEIDMSNADTFATALTDAVARAGDAPLVVDLTALEYLDSAGLAALFEQAERIRLVIGPLLAPLVEISGLAELTTVEAAG